MSRNSGGTYSLPAGNPVVTNEVISSSWANTTLSDVASELTNSLDRQGRGAMQASLPLFAGTSGAPGLAWGSESTSGLYRDAAGDFRWVISSTELLQLAANTFRISGTAPVLMLRETDAAANNGIWGFRVAGEQLLGSVGSDALSYVNWLAIDRTANVVDSITLTATTVAVTGAATVSSTLNVTGLTTLGALTASGVLTTPNTSSEEVGYKGTPQNAQTGNYTLVLADAGKEIYHASGAGAGDTYTIPANASVAFPVGTTIVITNDDSNSVSIAITSDTLVLSGTSSTGTRTLAANSQCFISKKTSTRWHISGAGLS